MRNLLLLWLTLFSRWRFRCRRENSTHVFLHSQLHTTIHYNFRFHGVSIYILTVKTNELYNISTWEVFLIASRLGGINWRAPAFLFFAAAIPRYIITQWQSFQNGQFQIFSTSTTIPGIMYRFNDAKNNDNPNGLMDLCNHNKILINNNFFDYHRQYKIMLEDNKNTKSIIDFLIINRRVDLEKKIRTLSPAFASSDHKLLKYQTVFPTTCKWSNKIRKSRRKTSSDRFGIHSYNVTGFISVLKNQTAPGPVNKLRIRWSSTLIKTNTGSTRIKEENLELKLGNMSTEILWHAMPKLQCLSQRRRTISNKHYIGLS